MQVTTKRIRLEIDVSTSNVIVDKLTGATPFFWQGNDVDFEFALFYGDTLLDPSNFASIRLVVKPLATRTGDALMDATIANGALNAALVEADWDNDSDQHGTISFANTETNFAITGDDDEFWLCIRAVTTAGAEVTLGTSVLRIGVDGTQDGSGPAAGDPTYYTAAQADARYTYKAGDTMTGLLQFSGTTHAGLRLNNLTTVQRDALTPAAGNLIYNTTASRVQGRQGSSWVEWVNLAGDTLTGAILFSGTTHAGLRINSLTTTQRDLLTPGAGDIVYNSTLTRVQAYQNGAWVSYMSLAGDTLTGLIQFSGVGHAGLKLNNLTTTERDALTASAGMAIYNTTTARPEFRGASAWTGIAAISGTPEANRVAIWDAANTIASDENLTWNGSLFTVTGTVLMGSSAGCGSRSPLEIVGTDGGLAITASSTGAAGTAECYTAGFMKDAGGTYRKLGADAFQWTDKNTTDGYASWNIHTTAFTAGVTADYYGLAVWAKRGATFFPSDLTSASAAGDKVVRIYAAASGASPNANAHLVVENNTTNYFQFLTPNTNSQGILFGDPESSAVGGVIYGHASDALVLTAGGVDIASITAGAVSVDGNIASTDGQITQAKTSDGAYEALILRNSSTGTSAKTRFKIGNNGSATAFHIDIHGGNFASDPNAAVIMQEFTAPLIFGTSGIEYMRLSGAGRFGINTTGPISLLDITKAAIVTTQDDAYGLSLVNTTAALVGTPVQYSPPLVWSGKGWDTDDATSRDVRFRSFVVPINGNTVTGYLTIQSSIAGAAYADCLKISSDQSVRFMGGIGIGIDPDASLSVFVYRDGAKTAADQGVQVQNVSTSSTNSIDKAALALRSTGTWNGTSAKNIGLYITTISGGTENWAIYNNSGADVYLGTGVISGGSLSVTGAITGGSLSVTGAITSGATITSSQSYNGPATNFTALNTDQTASNTSGVTWVGMMARNGDSTLVVAGMFGYYKAQEWTTTDSTNDAIFYVNVTSNRYGSQLAIEADGSGRVGIGGISGPTAYLMVAGSLSGGAGTASLKLASGTFLSSPEVGAVEYNGRFAVTETDGNRRYLVQAAASTKTTAGAPYTNDGYVEAVINGTTVKLMTTA